MIDTRSLVDRVYEYLLTQIVTGEFKYGDVVSIKKVAELLKISTMPVREALKRLEFERIVEIRPRSSCRILRPSRKLIREVYELREVIELFAATSGKGRNDPARHSRLNSIVEEMRKLDGVGDMAKREKQAIALDRTFHSELCALADNDFMNDFNRQLNLHVNMTLIHERTYHKLEKQWAESHAEIVHALERDPGSVPEVLRRHFENVLELLPTDEQAPSGAEVEAGGKGEKR
ncbi:MAG: GntR family transcriptional regulator [Spirochaetota bacterium]